MKESRNLQESLDKTFKRAIIQRKLNRFSSNRKINKRMKL